MVEWHRIKACLFDFDGTLVDTMQGFADIAAATLEKHYGIPFKSGRRQYLDTSGIPFFQQLEIICPSGDKNKVCAQEFESEKLRGFFQSSPSPKTMEALSQLHSAGYKLIVSSNNFQHNLDSYLEKYPLPLDLILGFDGKGLAKGRPHFEYVQQHFGITFNEMLFCGDSLKDAERAQASQVPFVALTGIFSRTQFLDKFPSIEVVDELAELVKELLSRSAFS